ncbi:DUF952 domain-containing protein [Mobilicoccus pelagius]|uniref:8-oxo-dGTP diphosphatase n=1 Tax=Mobilicoccus pelagius NBRC 104925 TaxID=1089455 RepID=H5UPB8_9MICO|nr:DUF952 domain-containing protein [Mobilicoccus pelagius]GAB47576.1 hypothetical protein MOPEL_021_00120 [Mobilicoccus pelagius NBRC 104925]
MTIYHLAFDEQWDDARASGEYGMSTRDATVAEIGFLHACLDAEQLAGVISRFYADVAEDLCVLALDEDRLARSGHVVRLEPGDPNDPASERFPHVYGGPIPVDAVAEVLTGQRPRDLVAAVRTHGVQSTSGEEWWDVRDADGRVTGDRFLRGGTAWPEGAFHLVVGICPIGSDGRVLVSQRSATKDWPLEWEFAAGSALLGETSRQAAARELVEEVGLAVAEDDLVPVGRLTEAHALFDFYAVGVPTDAAVSIDPVEVATTRWVDLDEVERMWTAGEFAAPWQPRLEVWISELRRLVADRA